jgi:Lrp/AsnC family transcriptional regulator, leucine-responsive regulatory protein
MNLPASSMVTTPRPKLDDVDRAILEVLRRDGRAPVSEVARRVQLSSAPVARRIERLERDGVIRGYAAIVDDTATGDLEAFTELRLTGTTQTSELADLCRELPEVMDFFTIAGDPDAVVRLRVHDVDHLQRVVNRFRSTGKVTSTKTLMVLYSWRRDHDTTPSVTTTPETTA